MAYKLNPLTGELDKVGDGASVKEKLNPVTGDFNLVEEASSYKQIFNPLSGNLQLFSEGGGGGVLPAGYARLEYIESTGTQYIDTGITSYKNTYKIKAKVYNNSLTQTVFLTGENPSLTSDNLGLFLVPGTNSIQWNWQYGASTRIGTTLYTKQDVFEIDAEVGKLIINNVTKTGVNYQEFIISKPLYILAATRIEQGAIVADPRMFAGKLYYFTIEDKNGNKVVNGIPCMNAAGVVGLYDTVSQTFLTNQGTGEFTAGPFVLPDGYTEDEYYITKGSELPLGIDTGIKPTYGMVVKGKYSVSHNSSVYIIGARAAGSEQSLSKPQTMTFSGSQNGGTVTAFVGGGSVIAKTNGENWTRVSGEENKYEIDVTIGDYAEGAPTQFTVNFYDLINEVSDIGETNTFTSNLDDFTPTIHLGGNGTDTEATNQRIYFLDLAWGTERRRYVPATQGEITGFYEVFTHEFIS